MGSNESQNCIYYDMYSSLAIVALSAQPPGVNELCVCVYQLLRIFVLQITNTITDIYATVHRSSPLPLKHPC